MVSAEKFLKDPNSKEFFDIFKFLIMQIDPQIELDGPMAEEIPQIMRRLKYPVEVNKSKLQAIAGPNTWPQLLAVLEWLVVVIQIHDDWIQPVASCQHNFADQTDPDRTDHDVLRSLHESYLQYLHGKDCGGDEERLQEIFRDRALACKQEIQRLRDQGVSMEQQILEFRSEHERLVEQQNAPKQLELERDRLSAAIQSQDAQVNRIEEEEKATLEEVADQIREIEELQGSVRKLQEQVECQAYSKKDIQRLKSEREQLRTMLESLRTEGEKAEHSVWELFMKESERAEAIGRLVRRVNNSLEAAPSLDQHGRGVRVDISEPVDVLGSLDFAEERQRACSAASAQADSLQTEDAALHEVMAEQSSVQEEIGTEERKCQRLRVRVEQLQRIREDNRIWSAEQLDDAHRAAEETEDALHEAQRGSAGPTVRDVAEVDELRLQLKMLRERNAEELARLKDIVKRDSEQVLEDRRAVEKELKTYAAEMDSLCNSVIEDALRIGAGTDEDIASRWQQQQRDPRLGGC
jgi:kinetochore protein NDC80